MSKKPNGIASTLLNILLVVLGLVVAVLAYALITGTFGSSATPDRENNPASLVGDIIQVEVRNGCGISGLAAEATTFLRKQGFDVVEVGDFSSFDVRQSMVIDRVGDLESAHKVAVALGIPPERVRQEIEHNLYLDASVVIGQDYRILKPFEVE